MSQVNKLTWGQAVAITADALDDYLKIRRALEQGTPSPPPDRPHSEELVKRAWKRVLSG
jgi:hypothetical protein